MHFQKVYNLIASLFSTFDHTTPWMISNAKGKQNEGLITWTVQREIVSLKL